MVDNYTLATQCFSNPKIKQPNALANKNKYDSQNIFEKVKFIKDFNWLVKPFNNTNLKN